MPDQGHATGAEAKPGGRAGAGLLFLREEEIRLAQDLLFFAYRDFTGAADPILDELGLGRAHHRALHFIGRNPEISVSELLAILRITKQSLARVLGALVERTTLTSEMLLGTFPLAPLLLLAPLSPGALARLRHLARRLALAVSLGALVAAPVTMEWRTWLSPGAMEVQPYQEVARVATRIWHQRTGLKLRYVAGTHWYENEIAFYSPDRPHAFKAFHYAEALWVTPARLARDGLLSVCVAADARCLRRTARFVTPGTTRTEVTLARRFLGHVARPVRFVITVIPPGIPPLIPPARSARRGPG
ncbi:MAG: MarR family transcriptional regulator [Acetobacteraceae bacterium]